MPFIVESALMREKIDWVKRFTSSAQYILVLGESGAGKSAFAGEIYRQARPATPLAVINCVFADEESFSSDFTGCGLKENGTLLLEEVSALTLSAQSALLVWLEKLPSGILVFATTRNDLEQEVSRKAFSKNLAAKLGLLPVYIPPLRQRPEDILPLARAFLERYSRLCKIRIDGFDDAAREALCNHRWPGNVRELKNSVEAACLHKARGVAVCGGSETLIGKENLRQGAFIPDSIEQYDTRLPLKTALDMFKSAFIKKTLNEFDGNRSKAAQSLEIQRTYLSALIKTLGIDNSL
ncbi:MAG: sigma 54-interacting transcriptional regulator [Spirochaetaceae bacterium]|jgi:Nif-specific regulatory protein|nr:sigma 54-interacting transcriptional regulator [Spirochaetaceae bacterium]